MENQKKILIFDLIFQEINVCNGMLWKFFLNKFSFLSSVAILKLVF